MVSVCLRCSCFTRAKEHDGANCSGLLLHNRVKQIPYWKQRKAENSTPEIEVMSNAMLAPPTHPRKQVKRFADMSKYDHHQTSCAEQLQERVIVLPLICKTTEPENSTHVGINATSPLSKVRFIAFRRSTYLHLNCG